MVTRYTLVIPAFNAVATIGEAVGSALAQSVPPSRVVVVDDGSTDDTAAVAAGLEGPVVVLRQPNQGPGAATMLGLAEVDTDVVAMLDADDLWLPRKAEAQLAALDDPGVAAVFTHVRQFRGAPDPTDQSRGMAGWSRTTLMMRTAVANAVGPIIDPPGRRGEMIDWLARMREAGHRLVMLEETLALRRVHPGSMTYARTHSGDHGYLSVARAALLRRRQARAGTGGSQP